MSWSGHAHLLAGRTITDIISFLGYGYSYEEIVFKKRLGESRNATLNSRFDDGQIALAGLPGRSQDSLWKWVFDDDGQIEGMIQNPPPDYLLRYIPVEKALHFRTTIFKNNPEGRSVLRNSYRPWYFSRNLQNLEGIGMERDLAGLPVLHPPPGTDIWDASDPAMASMRTLAQNVVSSIRRDEQEGVVLRGSAGCWSCSRRAARARWTSGRQSRATRTGSRPLCLRRSGDDGSGQGGLVCGWR